MARILFCTVVRVEHAVLAAMLVLAVLLLTPGAAIAGAPGGSSRAPVVEAEGSRGASLYVVQLADKPVATYEGGKPGLAATAPYRTGARKLDVHSPAAQAYAAYLENEQAQLLTAISARLARSLDVRFHYRHAYNGVALVLTPQEAILVAELPGVTLLFRDVEHELQTDAGPAYIGANAIWTATTLNGIGTRGEGVIVGVLDTGINHGHPSFAATDAHGYTHTNPFGAGNYVGYCVANPSFCNSKLIGAWVMHQTPTTPEDANGHGSHTASTAAGNLIELPQFIAPTISYQFAEISGVAPRANIIAYLVCAPSCPTTATTAAVNQAVIDGVDVINYSISGGTSPWVETTAVAFRNAVAAGVVVAASTGNAGPTSASVGHQGPWILSVGAGHHHRAMLSFLSNMSSSVGPLPGIEGEGASLGIAPTAMVYAGDAPYNNPLCNPFPANTFNGEIVVCDRGVIGRVLKGQHVLNAGGSAMVLINDLPSAASLNADGHVLPAVQISYAHGAALKAWMASGTGHMASISGGMVSYGPHGDMIGSLSSRGPAGSAVPALIDTIKPDVAAPGMNILAAYHTTGNPPAPEFNIISGTSMASPHAAGAAALLRALHPSWTVPEIKSALMMSSAPILVREDAATPADAFDQGAGTLNLAAAGNVGLVLDIDPADFVAANPATGGVPRLLNLPSMANHACNGSCSWQRSVRNPLPQTQQWQASVVAPAGISGSVTPASFTLEAGETQTLSIQINMAGQAISAWRFASVELQPVGGSPTPATLRLPIAAMLVDPIFRGDFE